ncbi:MAG: DNA polymerase IV [Candidatus Pacebacteria bacterium]|nr:DNA polymerase IV [Candidatus Paceibacterota bacterium]
MDKRIIAHLDMDAFFASIEEVSTPGFLGKPIVVGSEIHEGKGRGVVSTANYKAREYGIHSAQPITIAWRLSQKAKKEGKPEAIFLPVDFKLYNKVSSNILKIIKKYSSIVEQASIDEFYFDLSFLKTYEEVEKVCKKIKEEIKKEERITCSIGIGGNKLISKIAAGVNKPDGLLLIKEKDVKDFLNPLKIEKIPGIGPKTAKFFHEMNISTVEDLKRFSKEELEEMLGKPGIGIYYSAMGIDNSPVIEYYEVKSIGEQTTFNRNTLDFAFIFDVFRELSNDVFKRFIKSEFFKFNTITITIRFADFETKTSSKSFKEGFKKSDKKRFNFEVLKLFLPFLDKRRNPKRKLIRLIGVRVEKFGKK